MITSIFENLFKPVSDAELNSRSKFRLGDAVCFTRKAGRAYASSGESMVIGRRYGKQSSRFYYTVRVSETGRVISNIPEYALEKI